ncbi:MAG: hypothetical protein NZL95_04935 [Chitinophagales bacterium]|nr:hypothetical protein [Chitinophagales bacterium]MDW8427879.1 CpsB/CapC family capsule biosynthesis tyrosine phosphatase [Chitinophagales bacterium]
MKKWLSRLLRSGQSEPEACPSLVTDLHSHLLVGLDDGAATEDEALHMIRGLAELGYRKAITTPHIHHDLFNNTVEGITDGLNHVRRLLRHHQIAFEVHAAAEYFLDDFFLRQLDRNALLSFGERYVLFELPYSSRPIMLDEVVFKMNLANYKPVLAHPERYPYLFDPNLSAYRELKNIGVFLQLNLASLTGVYGPVVRRAARALVAAGLVDFAGTDLHKPAGLDVLQQVKKLPEYLQLLRNNPLRNDEL